MNPENWTKPGAASIKNDADAVMTRAMTILLTGVFSPTLGFRAKPTNPFDQRMPAEDKRDSEPVHSGVFADQLSPNLANIRSDE